MKRLALAAFTLAALSLNACATDSVGTDEGNTTQIDADARDGGEVEVYRSVTTGKFDFRLEAKNGAILVQSGQRYEGKDGAMKAALSLKDNGQKAEQYEIVPAASNVEGRYDGQWFFRVKGGNGKTLAFSEIYESKGNAIDGAEATMGYLKGEAKIDLWSDQCGFELFKGRDDQMYFRLRANNGEKLLASQGYGSETTAKDGIDNLVTNAIFADREVIDLAAGETGGGNTERFEVYEASNGDFGWRLKAANNKIIAHGGELFSSKQAALDSLELIRQHSIDEISCWTAHHDADLPVLGGAEVDEVAQAELPGMDPTPITPEIDAAPEAGGEVEIYRSSRSGKFDFRLESANGNILLQSGQRYEAAAGAINGALSLKASGQMAAAYELVAASNNPAGAHDAGWFVRVKAGNGATLGFSEVYETQGGALSAAETMQALLRGETRADIWMDQCGFELYTGQDGDTWFRLNAGNGEKLLRSQGYASEGGAKTGIDSLVTNAIFSDREVVDLSEGESAGNEERFEVYEADVADDVTERWGWRLVAANNQILANGGELFSSKSAAKDSLELVRQHALDEIACWTARNDGALPLLDAAELEAEMSHFE